MLFISTIPVPPPLPGTTDITEPIIIIMVVSIYATYMNTIVPIQMLLLNSPCLPNFPMPFSVVCKCSMSENIVRDR